MSKFLFFSDFTMFLKTVFSAEIPIKRDRYAYNSMPSVEIIANDEY